MSRALGLVPHLFVKDVSTSLSFYGKAFGAVELFRNVLPNGVVLFVELAVGGTPMLLTLETEDPDDLVRRAVFAGARVEAPVEEMFFGERYGRVVDPDGHRWALTTKRERFTRKTSTPGRHPRSESLLVNPRPRSRRQGATWSNKLTLTTETPCHRDSGAFGRGGFTR